MNTSRNLPLSGQRLWDSLLEMARIGALPNGGCDRQALTDLDGEARHLLRRWGEPQEVADVICFLASDAARYVTGTLLDVSGGKLATQLPQKAYERADAEELRP